MPYNVFLVSRVEALCNSGVLGSGASAVNQSNSFRYDLNKEYFIITGS